MLLRILQPPQNHPNLRHQHSASVLLSLHPIICTGQTHQHQLLQSPNSNSGVTGGGADIWVHEFSWKCHCYKVHVWGVDIWIDEYSRRVVSFTANPEAAKLGVWSDKWGFDIWVDKSSWSVHHSAPIPQQRSPRSMHMRKWVGDKQSVLDNSCIISQPSIEDLILVRGQWCSHIFIGG